ncbi:MAG: MCE family protein, partial [Erythrobacter sp.]|nr:MCE family protein [Erythrobacter sp.]
AAEATLRDLRATSKALRNVTERLENQGLGPLVEGQSLPDYKP